MANHAGSIDKSHANRSEHVTLRFILLDSQVIADSILFGSQGGMAMTAHDSVAKFRNHEECQKYIEHRPNYRLILITSGRAGRELVPKIHQLTQVASIYVFCIDENTHKKWACRFFKVRYGGYFAE